MGNNHTYVFSATEILADKTRNHSINIEVFVVTAGNSAAKRSIAKQNIGHVNTRQAALDLLQGLKITQPVFLTEL